DVTIKIGNSPNATQGRMGLSVDLIKRASGQYDVETVQWLDLHGRGLPRIQSLEQCVSLVTLDLSRNQISLVECLDALTCLQRLDLSSNAIERVEGLSRLAALEYLDLKGNRISDVEETATALRMLPKLEQLFLRAYGGSLANPLCAAPAYPVALARHLPNLRILDGESRDLTDCLASATAAGATAGGEDPGDLSTDPTTVATAGWNKDPPPSPLPAGVMGAAPWHDGNNISRRGLRGPASAAVGSGGGGDGGSNSRDGGGRARTPPPERWMYEARWN
ncbi:unnamed protein product, partial [Phaeothamnion confervicola]